MFYLHYQIAQNHWESQIKQYKHHYFYRTYMDARNEEVLRDKSNARNSKLSLEIEVSRKNKTLYLKEGKM